MKTLRFLSDQIKIHQVLVIFEIKNQFFFKFLSLFKVMKYNSSILFKLKFYLVSTKVPN